MLVVLVHCRSQRPAESWKEEAMSICQKCGGSGYIYLIQPYLFPSQRQYRCECNMDESEKNKNCLKCENLKCVKNGGINPICQEI